MYVITMITHNVMLRSRMEFKRKLSLLFNTKQALQQLISLMITPLIREEGANY